MVKKGASLGKPSFRTTLTTGSEVTPVRAHHARLDRIMEVTWQSNPAMVLCNMRDADASAGHTGQRYL